MDEMVPTSPSVAIYYEEMYVFFYTNHNVEKFEKNHSFHPVKIKTG